MDYKVKENKKSWTISTKQNNVTVTINIGKTICPDRKSLDEHLRLNLYTIGGDVNAK